jgi:hypothetical protein
MLPAFPASGGGASGAGGGASGSATPGAAGTASVGKVRDAATESAVDAAGRKGNTSTLAGGAPSGPLPGTSGNYVSRKSYLVKWQGLPYVVRPLWLSCTGRWRVLLRSCRFLKRYAFGPTDGFEENGSVGAVSTRPPPRMHGS